MIKPEMLKKGDRVAVVSLSSGIMGDPGFIHRYDIARERLANEFGVELVPMPNALKGKDFIENHPEARAKDLMDAFKDDSINGIICAIGGNDTIRTLPYIDFDVIHNNPKIFMGYSDTTVNHFMMNKAGVVSFYGPTIVTDFGEYVKMFDYTKNAVENILFDQPELYEIKPSDIWATDIVLWDEANKDKQMPVTKEEKGYEVLQGEGIIEGEVLGGCIDVFNMMYGTSIWPSKEEWKDKILLIETSEDTPSPEILKQWLKELGDQGIFDVVKGILVAKPYQGEHYEEYKDVYKEVLKDYGKEDLPVLYNMNIGHCYPIGIMPLGTEIQVDLYNKKVHLLEIPTKEKVLKK